MSQYHTEASGGKPNCTVVLKNLNVSTKYCCYFYDFQREMREPWFLLLTKLYCEIKRKSNPDLQIFRLTEKYKTCTTSTSRCTRIAEG